VIKEWQSTNYEDINLQIRYIEAEILKITNKDAHVRVQGEVWSRYKCLIA